MRHTDAEDNVAGYLRSDQRLHDRPLDPCCNVGEATHAVELQAQTQSIPYTPNKAAWPWLAVVFSLL
jgi:hypothetical protein